MVFFRNRQIPLEWNTEGAVFEENGQYFVEDGGILRANFVLQEGVFDMDTIFVRMQQYINCEGKYLPDQNFFFHFNRGEFLKIR
jgi:hypothetical protein